MSGSISYLAMDLGSDSCFISSSKFGSGNDCNWGSVSDAGNGWNQVSVGALI